MPSTHPYPADYGMPEPTVPRLLQRADALIHGERRSTYGDPGPAYRRIAAVWSGYIGHTITDYDVLNLMILMKACRAKEPTRHDDSYVDIAGYAGLTEFL